MIEATVCGVTECARSCSAKCAVIDYGLAAELDVVATWIRMESGLGPVQPLPAARGRNT